MNSHRSMLCILAAAVFLCARAASAAEPIAIAGLTEAILDADLSTPVSGIITRFHFREGDFVKKGEVILELDKGLETVEVARREVALGPLKTDLDAIRTLYNKPNSSVSKSLVEEKELAYNIAVKEHELALEKLRQRSLAAPFDGRITEIYFEVGEACQLQQPVLRLVDTRRCYLVCNVESKLGHSLKPGQTLQLEIESGAGVATVAGEVHFVSPVVDPASGLMKVKVLFDNSDGRIRPGVAGKMFLPEPAYANVIQ